MSSIAAKRKPSLEERARRTLLERRRDLMARREAAERSVREVLSEREPDWEDQAANETAAGGLERLADTERLQLAQVSAALERLDDGTWGWCVVCGQPIAEDRLRALPETARCADCTNHH